MKKILSIILTTVMLISAMVIPVYAINAPCVDIEYYSGKYHDIAEGHYLAIEVENAKNHLVLQPEQYIDFCYDLNELYYHYNDNGEMDWVFFEARSYCPFEDEIEACFNCRVVSRPLGDSLEYGFGIYMINEDKFYDFARLYRSDPDYRDDIDEVLRTLKIGRRIGDVNNDGDVNIIDATLIQKYKAGLVKSIYDDYQFWLYENRTATVRKVYISDMNHDGKTDISDATAVQKFVARLDYLS